MVRVATCRPQRASSTERDQGPECLRNPGRFSISAASSAHDALPERLWRRVERGLARASTPEACAGLADLYPSHADFVARYQTLAPGFAQHLAAAMKALAARRKQPAMRSDLPVPVPGPA